MSLKCANASHTADHAVRQEALEIQGSFIVQAPAGSGKTALLVQRFLTLLSRAEKAPEEILSVTFTRKAAAEMRERVLSVLQLGEKPYPEQAVAFVQQNWRLAQAVLQRDRALNWHLLDNPQRLQIQTIDALCTRITRQMPVTSGFGALPEISEDAHVLYEKAATRLLSDLETDSAWLPALKRWLLYLDNQYEHLKRLMMAMLACRDQWINYLPMHAELDERDWRAHLEQGLQTVIEAQLTILRSSAPEELRAVLPMAKQAAAVLVAHGENNPIVFCADLSQTLPRASLEALGLWQGLAALLLTQEGTWRKQLTRAQGFLPATAFKEAEQKKMAAEHKAGMLACLKEFQALPETDAFYTHLKQVRHLPDPVYSEVEWPLIQDLVAVLPVLVAELMVVFEETGKVDFVEMTMAANRALGDAERPSEILLSLDAKLRHILVDEFQDTSRAQFRLIEKLTAGWQWDDGRTLFLVGDPMQSIYRFRQADVSLFLQAAQQGIGDVCLKKLVLTTNFRSDTAVVSWNNQLYREAFPEKEDRLLGAIPFFPSSAVRQLEGARIEGQVQTSRDDEAEARQVLAWVQAAEAEDPQGSIAILVRTRGHLPAILQALTTAGVPFTGVDIEPLLNSVVVQNLIVVTRALGYLADRVAWLALLRMPWYRLSLADLEQIAQFAENSTVWYALERFEAITGLSAEGRRILSLWVPVMAVQLAKRQKIALRDWVDDTWNALGGVAYCEGRVERYESDLEQFYRLLDSPQAEEWLLYPEAFEAKCAQCFRAPKVHTQGERPPVTVMTLHKAKGLEFDTVILPGLGKAPMRDQKKWLLWSERTDDQGEAYLLFAPVYNRAENTKLYRFLQSESEQSLQLEALRLLYVATTRAKKRLHWIGHVVDEKPAPRSLLSLIWRALPISAVFGKCDMLKSGT